MTRFAITAVIFITAVYMLLIVGVQKQVNQETFVSKEVLAKAVPFDVKIDIEFLKSLKPAYE